MKLIELFEMAKGKTKRATQAKRRKKDKADKSNSNAPRNLVAMDMQTTGAGMHSSSSKDKEKSSKGRRKQGRKEIKNQMDY